MSTPATRDGPGGNAERPNIVWITLDSIRQDHTTMGGYERNTTPNMQRIAGLDAGTAFTQCISPAKWSLSSLASMYTCTYPGYHRTGYQTDVLPDHVETVAELLQRQGYRTGAVSANGYFCPETGTDRGFDDFVDIRPSRIPQVAGPRIFGKFLRNIRRHSAGFSPDRLKHRPDFVTNELVKKYADAYSGADEPFFLTAHYHGAHIPYYPPLAYQKRFLEGTGLTVAEAREIAFEYTTDIYEKIAKAPTFTEREWRAIVAMYDALVAYCDDLVGDLFDYLQGLDLGKTVFVVTADHGDLLGEYSLLGHKLVLHDALVHVPMVVHGAEEFVGRGDDLVQQIDVMQTLMAMAGIESDQFQGIDLRTDRREFAVSQRGDGGREGTAKILEHNPTFDTSPFHAAELVALRTTEFKYQRSADRAELFLLPDEVTDRSATYPDLVERFGSLLDEWEADHLGTAVEDREAAFSTATKQHLADMGYL